MDILVSFAAGEIRHLPTWREAATPGTDICMLDSGAFSAWSKGVTIDVEEYARFLTDKRGLYDVAFSLDVIGDADASERNLERLLELGHPVLPVFTVGASLEDFDRMSERFDYIALGGIARVRDQPLRRRYATTLVQRARERDCGVHLLGLGSPEVILEAGAYSADEAGTSFSIGYGQLNLFDGSRVVGVNIRSGAHLRKHRELLIRYGLDPVKVAREDVLSFAKGYRWAIQFAQYASNELVGEWMRLRSPVPPPRPELPPGPRRCSIPDFTAHKVWTRVEEWITTYDLRALLPGVKERTDQ